MDLRLGSQMVLPKETDLAPQKESKTVLLKAQRMDLNSASLMEKNWAYMMGKDSV